MHKLLLKIKTVPVALLVLTVAAHGVLVNTLGFYWDDWPMVWFAHSLGPAGYQEVFSGDRPFLAGIYILTTSLLPTTPLPWQILSVFSRFITALALWWTLRQLWPNQPRQIAWIAILFAVYPGFKQQPISVVYSNGFFLLAAYVLSWGWMLVAMRSIGIQRRYWAFTALALFSYAVAMFSTEYYVGLDMLRPLLIWLIVRSIYPRLKQQILPVIRHWLPYLAVLVAFLVWRVLIFGFPTYQPGLVGSVSHTPFQSALNLINRIFNDGFTAGWLAWIEPLRFPNLSDFNTTAGTGFWLVVLISLPLAWFFLSNRRAAEPADRDLRWSREALLFSLAGLLAAGWPFWITQLPISLEFPWDRFTLAFMIVSSVLIVALVEWLLRTYWQKVALMTLLVAMAAGSLLLNANSYRREWDTQKDFFWQLSWRAPALAENTLVLTDTLPLTYYSDNSLTAPLNWTYAPDASGGRLPYFLAYTQVRLGASVPALEKDLPVEQGYRNVSFQGNTSDAIGVFYSPPGCLRLLDPQVDSNLSIFPRGIEDLLPLSNLDRVITDPAEPAAPPIEIFGPEPEHGWCYYYQKAALAGQQQDWQKAAELGDEAFELGFTPGETSEYMLFSRAYAHASRWEDSMRLIRKTYGLQRSLQNALCTELRTYSEFSNIDTAALEQLSTAQHDLECPMP